MTISATVNSRAYENSVTVSTEGNEKAITIAAKPNGRGSSINGGELLFLSLATCFCNDVYREAERRKMEIQNLEVTVTGEFGKEGEPAFNITYHAKVTAPKSSNKEVEDLINHVDKVAEVHNTLRKGVNVQLQKSNA
jgi:uncharacterized OsmC-like protein